MSGTNNSNINFLYSIEEFEIMTVTSLIANENESVLFRNKKKITIKIK